MEDIEKLKEHVRMLEYLDDNIVYYEEMIARLNAARREYINRYNLNKKKGVL